MIKELECSLIYKYLRFKMIKGEKKHFGGQFFVQESRGP